MAHLRFGGTGAIFYIYKVLPPGKVNMQTVPGKDQNIPQY